MHDLLLTALAPLLALALLLAARRWPLTDLPRWGALAYLVPFAIACVFAFPSLDDWSYGASGRAGWWDAQRTWYVGWSGRVATTALLTAWGDAGSPWFAAVVGYRTIVALLFAGMGWALWDLLGAVFPETTRRDRGMLTAASAAGLIALLRDPAEGLYWLPGVASYGLGPMLTMVTCSAMLRGARGERWRWWIAPPALVIGCLSGEVAAGLALTATAVVILSGLRSVDRWRGAAVLTAGLLATAIVLLSPGNGVRAAAALREGQPLIDHAPLAMALSASRLAWSFLADAPWAPLAALGAWIAWLSPARNPPAGARTLALVPVFVLVAVVPMAWAGMSPGRSWNPLAVSSAVLVVIGAWRGGPRLAAPLLIAAGIALINSLAPGPDAVLVTLGTWTAVLGAAWLLHRRLDMKLLMPAVAVALLLGSERFASALQDIARGPRYAAEQQRRLTLLAGAVPGAAVTVPRLTGDLPYLYHTDDLHSSAKTWHNQGCAAFFGLDSVSAR